ncbi:MAG: MBL fold metallo-hydrolase [Myxococcales bacterium]|nr:MBL fold metallo-hydrolase [Myxococcales bacterium]
MVATLTALAVALVLAAPAAGGCPRDGIAVQVLGSGGPTGEDGRASSGYLLWIDGRARVLVDAGGGTFQRFAASGARVEDLEAIALTHLHVDHTSDLPALMKAAWFGDRERPLALFGPAGGPDFPATSAFVHALFDPDDGAFGYLGGYLDDEEDAKPFALSVADIPVSRGEPMTAYDDEKIRLETVAVPHGEVPALAWRVEIGDRSVVFMGDQRADQQRFFDLTRGTDLLVAHAAIPSEAGKSARALHATPTALSKLVQATHPGKVVLSHWMGRSLHQQRPIRAIVAKGYDGEVVLAEDGLCVGL